MQTALNIIIVLVALERVIAHACRLYYRAHRPTTDQILADRAAAERRLYGEKRGEPS
jgi:hypothetical protein